MRRITIAAVATAALVATAASAAQAGPAGGILGCTRQITIGGHTATAFCGPAAAVVHVGSRAGTVKGGSCVAAAGRFAVNVGISAPPGEVVPLPNWLDVTTLAGPRAGLQPASVSIALGGKSYAIVKGTLTLAAGRKSGSFAGLTGANPYLDANVKVRGTFTC